MKWDQHHLILLLKCIFIVNKICFLWHLCSRIPVIQAPVVRNFRQSKHLFSVFFSFFFFLGVFVCGVGGLNFCGCYLGSSQVSLRSSPSSSSHRCNHYCHQYYYQNRHPFTLIHSFFSPHFNRTEKLILISREFGIMGNADLCWCQKQKTDHDFTGTKKLMLLKILVVVSQTSTACCLHDCVP